MKSAQQAIHMAQGQLYTNEVTDPRILQAMVDVPREMFVPDHLRGAAYVDENIWVAPGRSLLAPLTFARLLALSGIADSSRVLVVGALMGYAAAVAARLAHHVVAVESDERMADDARARLARLKITNVDVQHTTSLADGYALSAPYDIILICGAVARIPESLGVQLALGGKLLAIRHAVSEPLVDGLGKGVVVTRMGGQLQWREHFDAAAALLPGFEADNAFRF